MLVDFERYCIDRLNSKFIVVSINIPAHLKRVAASTYKILMSEN